MFKIKETNARFATIVLIVGTFLIRIPLAIYIGLGAGESYNFRGALNFDLGYYDEPPMFFWLGNISTRLFGLNVLTLRFPSILLFAGTSWLLFIITRRFFNSAAGFWAVVMLNLSAIFTIPIASFFQADAPAMFFWLASCWALMRIFIPQKNGEKVVDRNSRAVFYKWVIAGFFLGLLTLSTFDVLFLYASIFLFITTNKEQRHWLTHPGLYIAILINICLALPMIIWNYQNEWASFLFRGSRAEPETNRLHFDWFIRSIFGQALWLLPWVWFPLVLQLIRAFKLRKTSAIFSFCFWVALLPIVVFTVVTLWEDLHLHFHWQAPGYLILFILLGNSIEKNLEAGSIKSRRTRRWIRIASIFTLVSVIVVVSHMATGWWKHYGPRWVASHFGVTGDPTVEGNDYYDLRTRFEKEGWMDQPELFVGAPRWWFAGKVDWVLRAKKDIICFSSDARNFAFFVDPQKLVGHDAIVVGRGFESSVEEDVKPYFDTVISLPDVDINRSGVVEMKLQLYYCKNFHTPAKPREDMPVYKQLTGRPPY